MIETGQWQVPKFQREFVWTPQQVAALLVSIFKTRPIGLITTWEQPQDEPLTTPEPLSVKGVSYKKFEKTPPVLKLVLDGKQRLTALTIAFAGLRSPDDRFQFAGRWFIDFKVSPVESDTFVVYKKRAEVARENLQTSSNCIAAGLFTLDQCRQFNSLAQRIRDRDFYGESAFPPPEELERRSAALAQYQEVFTTFQVPFAEIPKLTLIGRCL